MTYGALAESEVEGKEQQQRERGEATKEQVRVEPVQDQEKA